MKYQASFTILMDRVERFSAVLLRLALGAAFIAAAVDCIRFRRAGGEVTFLHFFQLPAAFVWAAIALEIMTGCALIVGFHIRGVALTCGTLLLLLALVMIAMTGFSLSLAALVITAAAGAFVLAARDSHLWSLDYFFSGDWLPIYKLRG